MHARGILALVVLVGALVGLRVWTGRKAVTEVEQLRDVVASHALLEGLTGEDMAALRGVAIDNLQLGVQVRIERDGTDHWFLTDPVAWPADVAVLRLFFQTLANDSGREAFDVDPKAAGLEPPLALAELDFGPERGVWTVEIGAPDLDGLRVYIRTQAPGHEPRILRANRSLEAVFQRFVPDYRSKAILRVDPVEVVEVWRRGAADFPSYNTASGIVGPGKANVPNPLLRAQGEIFPTLDLHLLNGSQGWRVEGPFSGAADPQALTMLLLTLCKLNAEGFYSDEAPDLARFGLDSPELEVELGLADRQRHRIRFARDPDERARAELHGVGVASAKWLCMVDDGPQVFVVPARTVMLAAGPAEAFFDYRILRGDLKDASSCRLEGGGRVAELVQENGQWFVSGQGLEHRPADRAIVEELLLRFRSAELGDLQPGIEAAPSFVPETLSVMVSGLERGGTFGPPPAGVEAAYLFRRTGDDLWASVDPELVALLRLGPKHFLERRLLEIPELRLGSVTLTRGELVIEYQRNPKSGGWQRVGAESESMAFGLLIDRLRSIKALEFAMQDVGSGMSADAIHVHLSVLPEAGPRGAAGEEVEYTLDGGADSDVIQIDGQRALLFSGLWKGLDALFD